MCNIQRKKFITFEHSIYTLQKPSLTSFILYSSIAFATAAAIAFFHGAEYLERNKIEDTNEFYSRWSAVSVIVEKKKPNHVEVVWGFHIVTYFR